MDLSEIVSACWENPGLWALVASSRAAGTRDAVAEVRRLAPDLAWSCTSLGGTFDLPNGSRLRITYVLPGEAVRRQGGARYQLVVTDGLRSDDHWYLASRVRGPSDGPPILGIHALTEKAGV